MPAPVYILGTGLSHDGSTCLLKDGKIIVAIEKERLTRVKHDGGNDLLTVQYCLDAAGIGLKDVSLVVQAANFEKENISSTRYQGQRSFAYIQVPVISISHHLAHAYSAFASSPFLQCAVLVIDGAGSPYQQCDDLIGAYIPPDIFADEGLYCEKDSLYHFDGKVLNPLYKDFSEVKLFEQSNSIRLPTNYHSIGGLYSAVSNYCFGNLDDAGKLMGLAPYGNCTGKPPTFTLQDGRCKVDYSSFEDVFTQPSSSYQQLKTNFQHYADIAWWAQQETVRAVTYLVSERMKLLPECSHLALAGGVALNAVANGRLLQEGLVEKLYIQPAAGDNGLAIGCAYYGWCKQQNQPKPVYQPGVFFGRSYDDATVLAAAEAYQKTKETSLQIIKTVDVVKEAAHSLAAGKIIGWFNGGAEFGPRALGHRSILADPRLPDVQLRINRDIKNREDFRPFAPSVRLEQVHHYFVHGYESPYMILTDYLKPWWREDLKGIVHVDGSSRVQTVTPDWNAAYYQLLTAFEVLTGVGLLLNTSFNVRGMPIVETPAEAIDLFINSGLDELYINDYKILK